MAFEYMFDETPESITLTFYIPPNFARQPSWQLETPTRLLIEDMALELHQPVHSPVYSQTSYFVELSLQKESPAKWYTIAGPVAQEPRQAAVDAEEPDAKEEEKPADSLMQVLCDVYAGGDSDVRRAMNKSLLESGGTVLSTNWKDVKDKKFSK
ncbi:suppressor of G2 allele of SKP1 [Pancytospora philotis]|nr:suppressor of G2 allele of SKP1 [Pancytospora philotis]